MNIESLYQLCDYGEARRRRRRQQWRGRIQCVFVCDNEAVIVFEFNVSDFVRTLRFQIMSHSLEFLCIILIFQRKRKKAAAAAATFTTIYAHAISVSVSMRLRFFLLCFCLSVLLGTLQRPTQNDEKLAHTQTHTLRKLFDCRSFTVNIH